ncbi:SynChlorMet cassette radical SAM/SPASM protein ScmF [Candidatus Fermentibacteria bacterium]|nr:SynChlorMet cassette radical SAM/SPASM protein ScmF [Candidatus Fermentibacteria bacterium]
MPPACGFHLRTLYFYVTEGCNCACRHCWIAPRFEAGSSPTAPSIEFDLFTRIVEQARPLGLNGVKLTGGEPLIHPEFERILAYLAQTKLRVIVETNGMALTPGIAGLIKACANPFVSVSIDGADAVTHDWVRGVEGSFDKALQGIRTLVDVGIRPQVIMSVMGRNRDQMEALVALAAERGASSVKFNIVTPTERGLRMHEAGETLKVEELVKLGEWVERTLIPKAPIRVFHSHPFAFKPLSAMFEKAGGMNRCGIFSIIGVLGNGSYALCGIGESVPELVFGDARTVSLEEVWNTNPVLQEIRQGLPSKLKGICGRCLMNGVCLGSCVAMNYYRHHDLFAPFWFCEDAETAGLFPASRLQPAAA